MKFDDLDKKMRKFETEHDQRVPEDVYIVARIDGRNFTRLTKETLTLLTPFDPTFRDAMLKTTEHLMEKAGFGIRYGYTQSDEISLVFDPEEYSFGRKIRKLNSVLAGEASGKFSLLVNTLATFDCRISQLPNGTNVVDYFRWRAEDANRNALQAHCYWKLREEGLTGRAATARLNRVSKTAKVELLNGFGVDFDELPKWQTRGSGVFWERYEKVGHNPQTGKPALAQRRRLQRDMKLPAGEDYSQYLWELLGVKK